MTLAENKASNRAADRGAPGGVGGRIARPFRLRGTLDAAGLYFLKNFLFFRFLAV
jgi:hypothetical protein